MSDSYLSGSDAPVTASMIGGTTGDGTKLSFKYRCDEFAFRNQHSSDYVIASRSVLA